MLPGDETIRALAEALQASPDNVPLRRLLAEALLGTGRPEEAEQEYRRALALAPEDAALQLGLATAFFRQGKDTQSLVIVERLVERPGAAAAAYLLHARLLLRVGDVQRAVRQYHQAVEFDDAISDPELAERLGIRRGGPAGPEDFVVEGRQRAASDEPPPLADLPLERPAISFADVGGMEGLKEEIRLKIIHPLAHPDLYRAYGRPIGGGILLYGPPGCGKSHLARATAGEVHARFLSVGLHDVLDMWIGESERKLHEIFEGARRHRPCVLFFDEVDALGASRADLRHSAGRQLINQFLVELDGAETANEGVLVLAATNAPWHLDTAVLRPGRFDRVLFVPPPDAEARAAILRVLLRGKPAGDLDYQHLARRTEGFSGADLKAVVDTAIDRKLQEAMKQGVPKPLGTGDLAAAAGAVRPSTREWFATARNYALYANQGGLYDEIARYLKL